MTSLITVVKIPTILFSILISSCAQIDAKMYKVFESTVGKPLSYLEDSIRGYRLEYASIPAGAKFICNDSEQGIAPFRVWKDLTKEQKDQGLVEIKNCVAVWKSGATSEISVSIPLADYPRFAHIVIERPSDFPNADIDAQYGREYVAYQKAQIEQAAAAIAGLGFMAYQLSKADSSGGGAASAMYSFPAYNGVTGADGSTWHWVSAGSVPAASFDMKIPSNTFFPLAKAVDCNGAIVNGACMGTVRHTGIPPRCAGSFINGRCHGSIIFGD